MLLSALSVLVVAQSSSEIPEGLMNNPVFTRTLGPFFTGRLSEIVHVLIQRIVLDVRCITLADCDNDHGLVVESVREGRPASK